MTSGQAGLDRPGDSIHEEFSRMNNELVTLQRAIAQRNAQLNEFAAELEQRVADRTRQLRDANAELETLAYAMAHDMRAPARQVDALAELLEDCLAGSPREQQWLALMRAASQRQCALVEDILEYLRLGTTPMSRERIDMGEEVALAIAEARARYPGGPPQWRVGDLPPAFGDRALVRAILRNLLDNAAKFGGGQADGVVEVGACAGEGPTEYFVRDNGVGFDSQLAGQLFKPFARLHPEADYPGMGIGLAIVKRLVARHEGRVWAQSAPGQGATFHFTLEGPHHAAG